MAKIPGFPPAPVSLAKFRKGLKPLRNVNKEAAKRLSTLDRAALWITNHVGTMGFFLLILTWTVVWLG